MTEVLLLSKGSKSPKTRLDEVLSYSERVELSLRMFHDVASTLVELKDLVKISVLTSDPSQECVIQSFGYKIVIDRFNDINKALNNYSVTLYDQGIDALLILPTDLPLITTEDVIKLLNNSASEIALVPAFCDSGTNAFFSKLPNKIEYHFGENSSEKFSQAAQKQKLSIKRMHLRSMIYDLDRPSDLVAIWPKLNKKKATYHYLEKIKIMDHLLKQ